MFKTYYLAHAPSRREVALAVSDAGLLRFLSNCGRTFLVSVSSITILDDDGYQAWSFRGSLLQPGGLGPNHECRGSFNSMTNTGKLTDFGIPDNRRNPSALNQLSDEELRDMIRGDRDTALIFKQDFAKYLDGLDEHDRLVAEAMATWEFARASIAAMLNHQLYASAGDGAGDEGFHQ